MNLDFHDAFAGVTKQLLQLIRPIIHKHISQALMDMTVEPLHYPAARYWSRHKRRAQYWNHKRDDLCRHHCCQWTR